MDKNAFLIRLSESNRTDFGRVGFDAQSDEQKVFSAVWVLEGEVNNGGFAQYFENDRGETARYAPTALRRIGAERCAAIVESALCVLGRGRPPADADAFEKLLNSLDEETAAALEPLDAEFFDYPDDLTELLFAHVCAHPKAFGPVSAD